MAELLAPILPKGLAVRADFPPAESTAGHRGVSVKHLFTEGRAVGTILLWIPNFMNLLLMYVIVNWLPALLTEAGMSKAEGVAATTFYSLGGILGTFAEGFLIKYGGPYRILLAEFGLCGLLIAAMSMMADSWLLVATAAFLLGFLVIGAQAGLNVLAAQFYPTFVRSTGVGWALGMGRIGSIVGPLLAGEFLSRGWEPWQVLLAGTVPALFALGSVLLGRCIPPGATPYSQTSASH